jgi:excisionase family DNA binding protein
MESRREDSHPAKHQNADDPLRELPEVLTVDEVAELLRINRKTVYDCIARRQLPGVSRLGRTIRIHRETLLQWLAGQGRVPRSRGKR